MHSVQALTGIKPVEVWSFYAFTSDLGEIGQPIQVWLQQKYFLVP